MVTVDLLRKAFEDIVGSYKPHLTFLLDTQPIKDRSADARPPLCLWVEPIPSMNQVSEILQDGWTIDLTFLEQTAKDRTALELSSTFARTTLMARHVFQRFHSLYIRSMGTAEGEEVDLLLQGAVTFPRRIYDDGITNLTGVAISATIIDRGAPDCEDIYFN